MEQALNVAKELYREYFTRYNEKMDEMKMHKLMYLVQRESLMMNKEVLFLEDFYGWRFGPVLKSIRQEYTDEFPFKSVNGKVSVSRRIDTPEEAEAIVFKVCKIIEESFNKLGR